MAITKVRDGGTNSTKTSGSTLAATVPAAGHAVGNLVVVFFAALQANGSLSSITDTGSNTWTILTAASSTATVFSNIAWSVLTTGLVSGDTITAHIPSGTFSAAAINTAEFSGCSATNDRSAASSNAGSTTPTSGGTSATTNATDLGIAAVGANGPTGDGFTNDTATYDGSTWVALPRVGTSGGSQTTNVVCNSAYLITTATGTMDYAPTLGTSRGWMDRLVALKASVASSLLPGLRGRHPAFRGHPPARGRF